MPPYLALFWGAYREKRAIYEKKDLSRYAEHRHRPTQADIVQRFRVAVRLQIARIVANHARDRLDKAVKAAWLAGGYFAEYRAHLRQLKRIGG